MRDPEVIKQKQELLANLEKELAELRAELEQAVNNINLAANLHNRALGAWKSHHGKLNDVPFDELESAAVEDARLDVIRKACHERYLAECAKRDKVNEKIKQWEESKAGVQWEINQLKNAPARGSWEERFREFGMR